MSESEVLPAIDLVSSTVSTARTAIGTGHHVDMTSLDGAVADLCAAVVALPQPHQAAAARKLARLADDLAALATALSAQRAIMDRASRAEARQRAIEAYPAETSGS
ncbi:MAG TPA: hypothetical protein VEC75_01800 [Stellaceae bacterium]|nr:hypothetical protein [Stellaceae bacterium]HYC12949.1 hypothetical protein [Stellaceae bacterium]